jgi:hypothetical protein
LHRPVGREGHLEARHAPAGDEHALRFRSTRRSSRESAAPESVTTRLASAAPRPVSDQQHAAGRVGVDHRPCAHRLCARQVASRLVEDHEPAAAQVQAGEPDVPALPAGTAPDPPACADYRDMAIRARR